MLKFFAAIYSISQSVKIFDKWIERFIEFYQTQKLAKINRNYNDYETDKMALYDALEMAQQQRDVEKVRLYRRKLAMFGSV